MQERKDLLFIILLQVACLAAAGKPHLNKFCPFAPNDCETEPYMNLQSCQLYNSNSTKLQELSSMFLCEQKDKFFSQDDLRRHKIKKRSTCNLCTRSEHQEIIYAAEDAQYGTNQLMELLQDPSNNLYQTYMVQNCETNKSPFNLEGRLNKCMKQWMQFTAAVFTINGELRAQRVQYPTHCAFRHTC